MRFVNSSLSTIKETLVYTVPEVHQGSILEIKGLVYFDIKRYFWHRVRTVLYALEYHEVRPTAGIITYSYKKTAWCSFSQACNCSGWTVNYQSAGCKRGWPWEQLVVLLCGKAQSWAAEENSNWKKTCPLNTGQILLVLLLTIINNGVDPSVRVRSVNL